MTAVDIRTVQVIAPNFKRRLSGVTATVVRLVPLQSRQIGIAACAPALPVHVPQIPLRQLITMPRHGPDGPRVWHARRNIEMIAGLALKYLLGKRLKLMFTSASQRRQSRLTRWLIRRMDAVVATSDKTAAYLEGPAQVIMHGIDTENFSPAKDRAALRARMGLPVNGVLIGCYGRIRPSKGTDIFCAAMDGPVTQRDAHALIMGRTTARDRDFLQGIKDKIAAHPQAPRFHFLPEVPVEKMPDWYRVLDLYVAPQRWEGFGLSALEAMACGVPAVATRVGAFEQIVQPGTGVLVPPGDAEALRSGIMSLLSAPTRIDSMSAAARAHVVKNFSIAHEAAALITLYRDLLAQR